MTESPLEDAAHASSSRASTAFLILLTIVVLSISRLTPPFQAPDEFNHIKRAYLLSHGEVFLGAEGGETGGQIDSGLLDYMGLFEKMPASYDVKVTQKMVRDSRNMTWSGKARFSPLANTAVYFPLSYLPQAVAFLIGEHGRLSVDDTFYLARTFSLVATIALLWVARRVYPVPLPVYGLFATPMVVFQLGSASLDAISFGLCVLVCALFMRAADERRPFPQTMHAALVVCLVLLVTARTNLIGIAWLPFVLYWSRRSRLYWLSAAAVIGISIAWIGFAALTVKGDQIQIQAISPAGVLLYYARHIGELISVLFATLTSGEMLLSYWRMFVGVLGWIDTPLDWAVYWIFALAFAVLAILSMQTDARAIRSPARVSLALGALCSTALLFIIFLATFTMHPAHFVGAIQGRYFYPMSIFMAFALFGRPMSGHRFTIGNAIVLFMLTVSAVGMVPKLIARYWADG